MVATWVYVLLFSVPLHIFELFHNKYNIITVVIMSLNFLMARGIHIQNLMTILPGISVLSGG